MYIYIYNVYIYRNYIYIYVYHPATIGWLAQVADSMNATAFSNYLEQGYYRSDGKERWGAVRVVSIPEPWHPKFMV